MNTKKIPTLAVLVTSFLLAVPLLSVPAFATPNLSAVLSSQPDINGNFAMNVMVSPVTNLGAYDIQVNYNPDILTAVSGTNTGTLFDPALHPVLPVEEDIFQAIGQIHWAVTFQGGVTVSNSAAASILTINFMVNDPTTVTPSQLMADVFPSAIVVDPTLVVNGVGVTPTTTPGFYTPPADAALRSTGCRADVQGLNVGAHGRTDGVFCRLLNSGNIGIMAQASFSWVALVSGDSGSCSSPVSSLSPGQSAEFRCNITFPTSVGSNDVVVVSGQLLRLINMPDGSTATISGPTNAFKIIIN